MSTDAPTPPPDSAVTDALAAAVEARNPQAIQELLNVTAAEAQMIMQAAEASHAVSDAALVATMPAARASLRHRLLQDGDRSLPRWSVAALSGVLATGATATLLLLTTHGPPAGVLPRIEATSYAYLGAEPDAHRRGARGVRIDFTSPCPLRDDVTVSVHGAQVQIAEYPIRRTSDDGRSAYVTVDVPADTGGEVVVEARCEPSPESVAQSSAPGRPVFFKRIPPRR